MSLRLRMPGLALPPEAVDRLRRVARTLIAESPEFARLPQDAGARTAPVAALAAR